MQGYNRPTAETARAATAVTEHASRLLGQDRLCIATAAQRQRHIICIATARAAQTMQGYNGATDQTVHASQRREQAGLCIATAKQR